MTNDELATAVRRLPLTTEQAESANEAFAIPATSALPGELVRRAVLTPYQAERILAGDAAALVVGRYIILDQLGGGGMGQVFKARDTVMDRVVALKLVRPDRLANETAVLRFQQEVRAAARLSHPNIVRAYDAGCADGRHFLVTELVTGYDLGRDLAHRGALPAGVACEYALQAALGLQHAHEQGLTHRDVKPSNLLYSTAERLVKVADFGLARLNDADGLTADGSVFGTPDYIAPEQASSAQRADIRSDLYSLGCTLYHFLSGSVPFPRDNAMAKLSAHASQEPEPLEDLCPGLSPGLIGVVRKLMAKNPADRYQTPQEVATALAPFCPRPKAARGGRADAPPTLTTGSTLVGPGAPVPAELPPALAQQADRKRRIALTIGCTVQVFGLLIVVATAMVTTLGQNANSTFSFVGSSIRPPTGSGTPSKPP